ncbi:retron St85 family effector protein [Chromobacterium violaceum]|uniref:retron St85 family effector protein n=1 Tax=Chromobacterium violaceum TaxID=536 RepID=UPI001BEC8D07|nr:retron St85 family effector protein [Chromobacterium violaceum]MBT2865920.1 retron St85 family effector protein [Chromobacterium violaceum]
MTNQIKNAPSKALEQLLEVARHTFRSGHLYWPKKEPHITFVCGKAPDLPDSLRTSFLEFNRTLSPQDQLTPILAEATFKSLIQLDRQSPHNLATLEKLIADIADSVIVFLESPGAIAELGYFSAFEEICSKTIVIIEDAHQWPSFISTGPAATCTALTRYQPGKVVINKTNPTPAFQQVHALVQPHIKEKSTRTSFEEITNFKSLNTRSQFFLLRELIYCFSPLCGEDMYFLIKSLFGVFDKTKLLRSFAVLQAIENGIQKDESGLFYIATGFGTLLDYDSNALKATVLMFYEKHMRERYPSGGAA